MIEIVVVTGIEDCRQKIAQTCVDLEHNGYIELENIAFANKHPHDVTHDVFKQIEKLNDGKYFIDTNSDHIINALRALKKHKRIDVYKLIHYGPSLEAEHIECEDNGEFSCYPDYFLDEWPRMLAELA